MPDQNQNTIKQHEPLWGTWYVEELLGEGSFGKVYKIRQREFNQTYYSAVKIISVPQDNSEIQRMRLEGLDDASIRNFFYKAVQNIVSEITLMREFRGNSNIVSYEDHMIIESPPIEPLPSRTLDPTSQWDILIRMELLTSLPTLAAEKPLSTAEIIKLGIHICRALELCTRKNIIHRDIKPENIFISPHGEYKLGDFGVARQIEQTMSGLSKKGTYTTMAPEVFKGEKYGANVDTYSLGIVMYALLNQNRAPFLPAYPQPITPQDRENALQRRMNGDPLPSLNLSNPSQNISPQLNNLILKACAYNRGNRYSTPTALRKDLEALTSTITPGAESITSPGTPDMPLNTSNTPLPPNPSIPGIASDHFPNFPDPTPNFADHAPKRAPGSDGKTLHLLSPEANLSINTSTSYDAVEQESPTNPTSAMDPTPIEHPKTPPITPTTLQTPKTSTLKTSNPKRAFILVACAIIATLAFTGTALLLFLASHPSKEIPEQATYFGLSINGQIEIILTGQEDELQTLLEDLTTYYIQLVGAPVDTVAVEYEEDVTLVDVDIETLEREPADSHSQRLRILTKQEALEALITGKPIHLDGAPTTQPYLNIILKWVNETIEEINFETETRQSDQVILNTTEIQQGERGAKSISYAYTARNGDIIESTLQDEKIIKEPVKEIIITGTQSLVVILDNKGITNTKLAAMVQSGEIPNNVTTLYMRGNKNLSDITPLRSLTGLTFLNICDNNINDLTPLKSLTKLTNLYLSINNISDLTPIQSLTDLTILHISRNKIHNLTPLRSLTNLTYLEATNNTINDLTPLKPLTKLSTLYLDYNNITNISPLQSAKSLTLLSICQNKVNDVSPLASLSNLNYLDLGYNSISDTAPLQSIKKLTWLNIAGNSITDFTPIKSLTNLKDLYMLDNPNLWLLSQPAVQDMKKALPNCTIHGYTSVGDSI
ncbi:MAG: protein kinase [Peptococcaceae bacterium]|nr:protein kinase [Peptococcaceae bacterium]